MAIKVAIHHKTHYNYDRFITLSPHIVRLRPAAHCRTPISAYTLKIKPENHFINWQQDPFGNYLARLVFPEKTKEFHVEVEVIAEMVVVNPFDFFVESYAENFPFEYEDSLKKDLAPYLGNNENGELFINWMSGFDARKQHINDFLVNLNRAVYEKVKYTIRMEPGVQSCEETLGRSLGSCRDSAWLLVQAFRFYGLAARFVSGYLVQLKPDFKPLEGPTGPEKDFTDLHAWAEVYLPGAGWVGLDPTSGLFAGEGHIPLACTPTPGSASPISGMSEKAETIFSFSNEVIRIHEDPRVTKPYSDDQWKAMLALGEKVDTELLVNDAKLTMGGEPTFVSIDDMEAEEWNTVAEGSHKRERAGDLLLRLREKFSKGEGLLHFGQGKWYPGELLPRWQLGLYWRKDGVPIWKTQNLVAADKQSYSYTIDDAQKFGNTLSKYLNLSDQYLRKAFEDVYYHLWEEGKLPYNIDPLKTDFKNSIEKQKLKELLVSGPEKCVGLVLPLKWDYEINGWKSRMWNLKREALFLVPGNSPMGLRLPLSSLEPIDPEKTDVRFHKDLFGKDLPLDDYSDKVLQNYQKSNLYQHENSEVSDKMGDEDFFRTALCIEPREGVIYLFLPPLDLIEHFLELVAAIEATAIFLSMPVKIEGYTPPKDNRIQNLTVTPDPGVIEVNIHPSETWQELVENYRILHDEAFHSRLGTEKFMLDGRHTGSGGGNHITLGSSSPENSPFLRNPEILRSLLTYWQHHPGLSYLFAGEFVGPTSQAPRFDEGRTEKIYEMEIAFAQIPDHNELPFWVIDRLFRHLLTDLTGNTHRAEFCIDKMYSPDSTSGRLGILELRAFDMPPHFQMSVLQMLLIRSLFAMLWKKPYKKKLIRWGTELHDRFMLEHFVNSDLTDVINDLNDEGFPFEKEWLAPFFEFRFPVLGSVQFGNIELEIRKGIEPWHVLGEEATGTGTARYVDSSVERIQVKITGLTMDRYKLTCNGIIVNLHNTGTHGEYVAGIRYRAWQPFSALHPSIPVDSPLVFDLVDCWNGKSVGGCIYYVSHPGGRSYEVFPVNASEAESRRGNRFWRYGHTPGVIPTYKGRKEMAEFFPENKPPQPLAPMETSVNPEYPYTLDLRLYSKKKDFRVNEQDVK